jgi:hypothetical protein
MSLKRKDFLKKICISGACICGFSSLAYSAGVGDVIDSVDVEDKKSSLSKEWISNLLHNVSVELDKEVARKLIKKTSVVHYNDLKMDALLAEYKGELDKFIVFLGEKWGWKIEYDKPRRILIADENKNFCVCPMATYNKETDSSAICYCSEGFAEKMFSIVSGKSTQAEVVSSIRRGDASCKYKIVFSNV